VKILRSTLASLRLCASLVHCFVLLCFCAFPAVRGAEPIRLHPDNSRYFLWRGAPTILITSGEHYGAVLNLDFDFIAYLDELKARGFNLTRIFSGAYREIPGSFNIKENTLAPKPGRFIAPWLRSATAGASDRENKFDLTEWDPAYFVRLKTFLTAAAERGVIVEYVFFCTMYSDELWQASPMNARNNVNGIGQVGPYEVYAAKEPALQRAQENLVRKIVTELKDVPNLYYEICNEPYERGGLTREWNDRIIEVIRQTEANFPRPHLIAQGFNREPAKVENPNPAVSIFNFHAASARNASENLHHKRALADDETGGKGIHPFPYRREAWQFILAGGAVFDHLDFSFTPNHPAGDFVLTDEPGGGGPEIRAQLAVLKKFIHEFDFIRMEPDPAAIRVVRPEGVTAATLSQPGVAYAVYIEGRGPCELALTLPAGNYLAEWLDPKSGRIQKSERFLQGARAHTLQSEAFAEDLALRIRKSD
jgi:hypothetical protein